MAKLQTKPKPADSGWEVTTERFVAYIDIMGFKDLVARKTHNEIYEMMKKIDERKMLNASIKWDAVNVDLVSTTTYSDSIIIYSKDATFEALYSLVCTVSGLSYDLFIDQVPHKGGVAFGLMTLDIDKSIFFGQPLIDAYLLEEEVNFYGVIIHGTAEEKIDLFQKEGKLLPFLENYFCPLKNGNADHLTIIPLYASHTISAKDLKKRTELVNALKKLRFNTSGHLRKYIDATEKYFNFFQEDRTAEL